MKKCPFTTMTYRLHGSFAFPSKNILETLHFLIIAYYSYHHLYKQGCCIQI